MARVPADETPLGKAIIRRSRNDAGHPTGASIEREHAYVNLQLFPPFARKVSQLTNALK